MYRRIMLLVSSMDSGGAERVASILVNAWAERGDAVTLVPTFSGRGECFYPVSDRVKLVYLADVAGKTSHSLVAYNRRFWALRRLIREIQPDVVVSFLVNVNVAAILTTRGLGIPVIACEHINPQFDADIRDRLKLLRRLTYRMADIVTLLGEDMVSTFRVMVPGIKHLKVIPNPLPDALLKVQGKSNSKVDHPRLIAMGRLSQQKQFEWLITAFGLIAADFPDWELWIWGEGPLRLQLEQQVRDAGLDSRVFLPGRTTNPWEELGKAEIFVLSSAYEGFPMVLLEAMALGLPCVAFDCPSGPREMTQNGQDSLLVPAGDRTALVEALRRVMSDAALRRELGERASASVRKRYTLNKVLPMWDDLFDMVALQRKSKKR